MSNNQRKINVKTVSIADQKQSRTKKQKYSRFEQLGFVEEYKEVFKVLVFGLGGICYQYLFGQFAKSILEANYKNTKNIKKKEYVDKETAILKQEKREKARHDMAVSKLVRKLEEAQLIEAKRVDQSNVIRALPKLFKLLGCRSQTVRITGTTRLKTALLGAYYINLLQEKFDGDLSKLNEYIMSGNISYNNLKKNIALLKNLHNMYKENNWNQYNLSQIASLHNREHERVKFKKGIIEKMKNNNTQYKTQSQSMYSIYPESEDLTTLCQKNIFIEKVIHSKGKSHCQVNLLLLDINSDMTPYKAAKKIALTFWTLDSLLNNFENSNDKVKAIFQFEILSLDHYYTEEDQKEITEHLSRFKIDFNASKRISIFNRNFPDTKKRLFGKLILSQVI